MIERVVGAFLCAVVLVQPALAQVGHEPERSPYRDLEYSQELTLLSGWMKARHDPAGIAPNGFAMLGARYEWTLTGPLALSADVLGGSTHRDVIDPLRPAATRHIGTQSSKEFAADLALVMNLTGARSWHGMVPQVRTGLGVVHNGASDDSTGFAFGTPFAFSFGGGVKYVPNGRVQLRVDLTDRLFKLNYADAYYRAASDNTSVLSSSTARSFYTHHTALTVGLSYLFAR